jgi:ribonucleotide monophosphatase NagD (HAD superfamily)
LVVGDRPSTDGLLAGRLGVPFALVRSGVTTPSDPITEREPDIDAADLATVVDRQLSG